MNVFRRALRGMREHTWLSFVSTSVLTMALVLAGGFALGVLNLRVVLSSWEQDGHVSAYLRADTSSGTIEGIRASLAQRPEVAEVSFVSEEEARSWVAKEMPEVAPSLGDFAQGTLPASFEIRLKPEHSGPEALRAFTEQLRSIGPWTDIDSGEAWLTKFSAFVDAATLVGGSVGALVVVAALFLVMNTVSLVVYARRDELEIMRLVGATDGYILGPFVLEGALQGLAATAVALGALWGGYLALAQQLAGTMQVALGADRLAFLPTPALVALGIAGVGVGSLAALLSVRRFLARVP
jgi:cell division transport system permease protein